MTSNLYVLTKSNAFKHPALTETLLRVAVGGEEVRGENARVLGGAANLTFLFKCDFLVKFDFSGQI